MNEIKTWEERLDYLLEQFRADSDKCKNIEIPNNISEKQALLRSLMNVRMPKKMSDQVIKVQDEYLSFCVMEKGIVKLSEIPVSKNNLSIWQGDIHWFEQWHPGGDQWPGVVHNTGAPASEDSVL